MASRRSRIPDDRPESHAPQRRDNFAINYGTGGIGAEILANRFGVGPMWHCTECKYEEFFLSSWAVGDPAIMVDRMPANQRRFPGGKPQGLLPRRSFERPPQLHRRPREVPERPRRAERAPHLPPPRPSVAAHTRQRQLDLSRQPGHRPRRGFTYEIAYNGSGNRNKTVAMRSSTAISIPTSPRACGSCGGATMSSSVQSDAAWLPDGETLPQTRDADSSSGPPADACHGAHAERRQHRQCQARLCWDPSSPPALADQPAVAPPPPLDMIDDGGRRGTSLGGPSNSLQTRPRLQPSPFTATPCALAETGEAVGN